MQQVGYSKLLAAPTTPAPRNLYHLCPYCGEELEPLYVFGKWRKQGCSCERLRRLEREAAEKLQLKAQERIAITYNWTGIDNSKLVGKRFDNFNRSENPLAFDTCLQLAENLQGKIKNIILIGGVGIGKSHLAAAICNHLREHKDTTSRFAISTEWLNAIAQERDSELDVRYVSKQTPLLVLDDIGQLPATEARISYYQDVINSRYNDDLPTVITTNKPALLQEHLGEAALSRLTKGARIFTMNGEDHRPKE